MLTDFFRVEIEASVGQAGGLSSTGPPAHQGNEKTPALVEVANPRLDGRGAGQAGGLSYLALTRFAKTRQAPGTPAGSCRNHE